MSKDKRKGPSKQQRREMRQRAEYREQNAELVQLVNQMGDMLNQTASTSFILRDPRVPKYLNKEELAIFVEASEAMGTTVKSFAEQYKVLAERTVANSTALRERGEINSQELQQLYFQASELTVYFNNAIGPVLTIITNTAQYVTDCESGKITPNEDPVESSEGEPIMTEAEASAKSDTADVATEEKAEAIGEGNV